MAINTSRHSLALINIDAWRSLNSLIGRVCGTSKRACVRKPPSFITWVFEAEFHAILLPTQTNPEIGKNYAEFSQNLIHIARILHADDTPSGLDISDPVYTLDSSTIDLCLSSFPWAQFRKTKGAIKLHTLLDLHSNIPTFLYISDGKLHDVNSMDFLLPEAGAFYIMDRAYLDFERLHRLHLCG